jgi:hypothetical protein
MAGVFARWGDDVVGESVGVSLSDGLGSEVDLRVSLKDTKVSPVVGLWPAVGLCMRTAAARAESVAVEASDARWSLRCCSNIVGLLKVPGIPSA